MNRPWVAVTVNSKRLWRKRITKANYEGESRSNREFKEIVADNAQKHFCARSTSQ